MAIDGRRANPFQMSMERRNGQHPRSSIYPRQLHANNRFSMTMSNDDDGSYESDDSEWSYMTYWDYSVRAHRKRLSACAAALSVRSFSTRTVTCLR